MSAATVPAGAFLLRAAPNTAACWRYTPSDRAITLECEDRDGNSDAYTRWYIPRELGLKLHPALYSQHMTRVDAQGRRWNRIGTNHVMDDFGMLVPVGGAA